MKYYLVIINMCIALQVYSQTTTQDTIKKANLNEVKINAGGNGNRVTLDPIRTEKLTGLELRKNACCNLAESFESNPTVEVNYSNAITGAKQIQMLGLSGSYVQTLTDILPTVRGLNFTNGLNYIPSAFVNSISVNKGPGSVVNGFESMTGQINIDLLKPEKMPKLFVNAYINSQMRSELNVATAYPLSKKWFSATQLHGSFLNQRMDFNKDGFMDQPIYKQFNIIQRFKFFSFKRVESMMGAKWILDDKMGGQMNFNSATNKMGTDVYGFGTKTDRKEIFCKTSYAILSSEQGSLGLQMNYTNHKIDAFYGVKPYTALHQSIFANFIYQNNLFNEKHFLVAGASVLYDTITEKLNNEKISRNETVTGVYAEYTFTPSCKYTILLGNRIDYNVNLKKAFYTPRLNVKLAITDYSIFRISAGTGFRSSFIISENNQLLVSNRTVKILEKLKPEQSVNYGLNYTYNFHTAINKESRISVDLFRTDFINQTIADYDSNFHYVYFYNLNGKSFANYFQIETYFSITKNIDIRLAYKYNQVKTTYHGVLQDKLLNPNHRALFNIAYNWTKTNLKFDFTTQYVSSQRLANLTGNSAATIMPKKAPDYFRLLGQISYNYKKVELYAGSENINNFIQQNTIIAANTPFNAEFDASQVWGPTMPRVFYLGARFTMN